MADCRLIRSEVEQFRTQMDRIFAISLKPPPAETFRRRLAVSRAIIHVRWEQEKIALAGSS